MLAVHSVVLWDWVDSWINQAVASAQTSWLIPAVVWETLLCPNATQSTYPLQLAISHTQEPDPIRTLKSTCGEVHQYWPWRQTGNMRLPIAFCQVASVRQRSFRICDFCHDVSHRLRPFARVCNPNAHVHKMTCRRRTEPVRTTTNTWMASPICQVHWCALVRLRIA